MRHGRPLHFSRAISRSAPAPATATQPEFNGQRGNHDASHDGYRGEVVSQRVNRRICARTHEKAPIGIERSEPQRESS